MAKVRYKPEELPEVSAEAIRRIAAIKDEDIDTGDMPELTEEFWQNAEKGRLYCEKEQSAEDMDLTEKNNLRSSAQKS